MEKKSSLKKDNLIANIPKFTKEYKVSFQLKINKIEDDKKFDNIIHLTTGDMNGKYGTRTPGIWLDNKNKRLAFHSAVNNVEGPGYPFITKDNRLKTGEWFLIEVSQRKVDYEYRFTVSIDGKELHNVVNTAPAEFSNVKVYAANPWHATVKGSIRKFMYQSKN